jgi:hypothetical protein
MDDDDAQGCASGAGTAADDAADVERTDAARNEKEADESEPQRGAVTESRLPYQQTSPGPVASPAGPHARPPGPWGVRHAEVEARATVANQMGPRRRRTHPGSSCRWRWTTRGQDADVTLLMGKAGHAHGNSAEMPPRAMMEIGTEPTRRGSGAGGCARLWLTPILMAAGMRTPRSESAIQPGKAIDKQGGTGRGSADVIATTSSSSTRGWLLRALWHKPVRRADSPGAACARVQTAAH